MTMGADGAVMHSLHAAKPGRLTVRLLKTSPINAILSAMYNLQQSVPGLWGINAIQFADIVRGDVVSLTSAAFAGQPAITYDVEGPKNEWIFDGVLVEQLGALS